MLPSTGFFKGINCPFYDSGLCERPYCHFRHSKKEPTTSAPSDGIESGAILQKLVSAAVQKVLKQSETSTTPTTHLTTVESGTASCKVSSQVKVTYNPTPIAELNKMVIADPEDTDDATEQRKRHIPVPYTPRKPSTLPVKRPLETNGASKPFIYIPPPVKYTPGCPETTEVDQYTPKGTLESKEKYLPGTETALQEYTPKTETHTTSKHNYVPSDKNVSKKKILEYKPVKINSKPVRTTYQPTPKALVPCFSSDEDEPDTKKPKVINDLNGLDDLGPEFDILDQILDEETQDDDNIKVTDKECATSNDSSTKKESSINDKNNSNIKDTNNINKHSSNIKDTDLNNKNSNSNKESSKRVENSSKKHRSSSDKHDKKSKEKAERKDKDKHSKPEKQDSKNDKHESKSEKHHSKSEKHESKSERSENKSEKKTEKSESKTKDSSSSKKNHKSSSKDKSREDKKEKSTDKKKHSSNNSKSSEKSSKHMENGLSKISEKYSKHSSSSRSEKDKKRNSNSHSNSSKDSRHRKKNKEKEDVFDDKQDDSHFDNVDDMKNSEEDLCDFSESDEDAIALECKRIFDEYVPTQKPTNSEELTNSNKVVEENNEDEYIPVKKRISRTVDKNIKVIPKAPLKPDYKVSAAQALATRLEKIKEYHASRKQQVAVPTTVVDTWAPREAPKLTTSVAPSNNMPGNTKIRIAHVPYASTMMTAKKVITPNSRLKPDEPSTSSTTIQTVKKGTQRVAHMPNEKFIDRPGVLEPLASKIAANIRSIYLNMMIDECLKIYLSPTDAYARAQHEELATSKKCSTVQIYKNSAVLAVSRLRKEFQECNGVKKSGADCTMLQKMPQSLSDFNNSGSWSILSKNRRPSDNSQEFAGIKFYNNIKKWILTEEQLVDNGFPRPHVSGAKGRAIIYGQNKQPPPKGFLRTCCRCKKSYSVDKKGFPTIKEECIYHPKNKYRVRGEVRYQCCSQDNSSDGCCIASCHVYEYVDFENLKGFIKTMPPDSSMEDYGVYSLDCEMCYTTQGLDLTRVTVINSACKVVYETLIKPLHPIIDYNTRYSGITEEQMANVKTTLLDVQATLLTMFNSNTILVGHSLESDFKALKLIHDTVIDTSVLFPHKMGHPYKRALRNLSSEYLKKIIQNSVEGHDSAEDATVCMELLIYKLKEDLKTR